MLNPTPSQILRTIEATLVDVVEPAAASTAARSALATIGHLLRHVILYVEQGGQILSSDIADSYALLDKLGAYYTRNGNDAQLWRITDALTQADHRAENSLSLDAMGQRAAILRQAVQDALIDLQQHRSERAGEPAYDTIRNDIRDYLARQLTAEAALIHPAFADKGPRR
jgi:hypothetical protein